MLKLLKRGSDDEGCSFMQKQDQGKGAAYG